MTHTSGPWTVVKLPEQRDAFDWAVADGNGNLLAGDLPSGSMARYQSEREAQAHADNLARLERKTAEDRLHAAAPDMLEALKGLAALWQDGSRVPTLKATDIATIKAVISKAEGRT